MVSSLRAFAAAAFAVISGLPFSVRSTDSHFAVQPSENY
jgi:hypothetical protein